MSSVHFFLHNCPQWLLNWWITSFMAGFICIWSLLEYISIHRQLYKIHKRSLETHTANTSPTKTLTSNILPNYSKLSSFAPNNNIYNNNIPPHSIANQNQFYRIPDLPQKTPTTETENQQKYRIFFGSRLSQKLFVLLIFVQSLMRSISFLTAPFVLQNKCHMEKIDSPQPWFVKKQIICKQKNTAKKITAEKKL